MSQDQRIAKLEKRMTEFEHDTPSTKTVLLIDGVRETQDKQFDLIMEKLDEHKDASEKRFDDIEDSIKLPVNIVTTANNVKKGIIWTASVLLAIGAIVGIILKVRDWIITK